MPDIVPKSPAEPRPFDPDVQDWVSELQGVWANTGLSINRFALLHPIKNKDTISLYLQGTRIPRDRWFLDTLLAVLAENGKPVTPNVREYLIELNLRALQSAHPHEYLVRLVLDDLEIAHTGQVRAELQARDLEEQLAERKRRIDELADETGRLQAARNADRAAMQAEYERLTQEADKITRQLHQALERASRAERHCQRLEEELERLNAHDAAAPDDDPERGLLLASADDLDAADQQHLASLVESLRRRGVQKQLNQ